MSGDIKTAFLSGDEEHRNTVILPLDDVRNILKLSPGSMQRLREAVYGLVDAPKTWWDGFARSLLNRVFTSCALDPCAFVVIKQNKVSRVTGVHVDDLLGGGDEVFDRIDVGASGSKRDAVDTDDDSRNHDRHGAPQTRGAIDRSLEVRQTQT